MQPIQNSLGAAMALHLEKWSCDLKVDDLIPWANGSQTKVSLSKAPNP